MSDQTPIISRVNLFRGLNPLLQSLLQNNDQNMPYEEGVNNLSMWPSFHHNYITDLGRAVNDCLPPGYEAYSVQGLQINLPEDRPLTIPAVNIFKPQSVATPLPSGEVGYAAVMLDTPTLELSLDALVQEFKFKSAVGIFYKPEPERHGNLGKPVTMIELLSPSNKIGGGARAFLNNYFEAAASGISVITLDYLHETRSPFPYVPLYPRASNAHPFYISIVDARRVETAHLTPDAIRTLFYGFDIDTPIPLLTIPLKDQDTLQRFDLNTVYSETFSRSRLSNHLDYAKEPYRMEKYSATDQERIRTRLMQIREMAAQQPDALSLDPNKTTDKSAT